jgi:hypothetical protein
MRWTLANPKRGAATPKDRLVLAMLEDAGGPRVAGLLVALPILAGPILFF